MKDDIDFSNIKLEYAQGDCYLSRSINGNPDVINGTYVDEEIEINEYPSCTVFVNHLPVFYVCPSDETIGEFWENDCGLPSPERMIPREDLPLGLFKELEKARHFSNSLKEFASRAHFADYNNWSDYIEMGIGRDYYLEVYEENLPDFKALKRGEIIYHGKKLS